MKKLIFPSLAFIFLANLAIVSAMYYDDYSSNRYYTENYGIQRFNLPIPSYSPYQRPAAPAYSPPPRLNPPDYYDYQQVYSNYHQNPPQIYAPPKMPDYSYIYSNRFPSPSQLSQGRYYGPTYRYGDFPPRFPNRYGFPYVRNALRKPHPLELDEHF